MKLGPDQRNLLLGASGRHLTVDRERAGPTRLYHVRPPGRPAKSLLIAVSDEDLQVIAAAPATELALTDLPSPTPAAGTDPDLSDYLVADSPRLVAGLRQARAWQRGRGRDWSPAWWLGSE